MEGLEVRIINDDNIIATILDPKGHFVCIR